MKAVARTVLRYSALFAVLSLSGAAAAGETIVMIRHGEKPELGLGQLTCQGLNRALALPPVLLEKYGKPAAIFAPNLAGKKDFGVDYAYIRPLATIEPTAIRLGLPVNVQWRFDEIEPLQEALTAPAFKDATLFVAWEHHLLEKAARELLRSHGGDAKAVPKWPGEDFDSIYVIRLGKDADGKKAASFSVDKQGLNNLPSVCP
jgi:hypothetical protein